MNEIQNDKTPQDMQTRNQQIHQMALAVSRISGLQSVLDVGCAKGQFVVALRELGVEAWGSDPSAETIDQAPSSVRPFLGCCAFMEKPLPEGFPQSFDLITIFGTLNSLNTVQAESEVERLCSLSDSILFSLASPASSAEHWANWARRFASYGFVRSMRQSGSFLGAILFIRNNNMTVPDVVANYEFYLRPPAQPVWYNTVLQYDFGEGFEERCELILPRQGTEFHCHTELPEGATRLQFIPVESTACVLNNVRVTAGGQELQILNELEQPLPSSGFHLLPGVGVRVRLDNLPTECISPVKLEISASIHLLDNDPAIYEVPAISADEPSVSSAEDIRQLRQELSQFKARADLYDQVVFERNGYRDALEVMRESTFWKITGPLRSVVSKARQGASKVPALRKFYRWARAVRRQGPVRTAYNKKHYGMYDISPLIPGPRVLNAQRTVTFSTPLTISIITPLYNTPETYLRELLRFMQAQTYTDWQLCLADGSDAGHTYVGDIVAECARTDKRILYKKLERNGGISDNTNAALEMATGDYIGLLDHDDILSPNALYEIRKAIDEQGADFLYSDEVTFRDGDMRHITVYHFKPDFAIDNLRANNYICHFTVFKRSLLTEAGGGFCNDYDGSQDFDMVLRLTEKAKVIAHVPKVLYFWRQHAASVASGVSTKPYAVTSAIKAVSAHLRRQGMKGEVKLAPNLDSIYRISYEIEGQPLVSIIIPNKDSVPVLKTCLDSIFEKTTWPNYEIIICENNSSEPETFEYYKKLEQDPRVQVVRWEGGFNYAAINNFAAGFAKGGQLLFLNNDTSVISAGWIEELLMFTQRSDVGAAGAKLYYEDNTLQHGGVVLGVVDSAVHMQSAKTQDFVGYMGNLKYARNVSAVTAACMMVRRDVFDEVGGFNENYPVAYNDVDLCLRIRRAGYLIVFTPFSELYHYESKTRGNDLADPVKEERLRRDIALLKKDWNDILINGDPYFNPNLRRDINEYQPDFHILYQEYR